MKAHFLKQKFMIPGITGIILAAQNLKVNYLVNFLYLLL